MTDNQKKASKNAYSQAITARGFCVWLTGLSGSGKTTTARDLLDRLTQRGIIITYLDGDVVRQHLSRELGFSREDRDTNIRRIGFVASEVVRHDGGVIVAAISPYRSTREEVRQMIGKEHFIEVFVDTPLEICERRDVKGMYSKARRGELTAFTGVDDPYEPPADPEIQLDTVHFNVYENVDRIIRYLEEKGFLEKRD